MHVFLKGAHEYVSGNFLTFEESTLNKRIFIFIELIASNFSEHLVLSKANFHLYWARVDLLRILFFFKIKNFPKFAFLLQGYIIGVLF